MPPPLLSSGGHTVSCKYSLGFCGQNGCPCYSPLPPPGHREELDPLGWGSCGPGLPPGRHQRALHTCHGAGSRGQRSPSSTEGSWGCTSLALDTAGPTSLHPGVPWGHPPLTLWRSRSNTGWAPVSWLGCGGGGGDDELAPRWGSCRGSGAASLVAPSQKAHVRTGLLGLCVPWEARALSICFLLRSALGPDGACGSFWPAEPGAGAGLPGAWGVLWRGERGSVSLAALSLWSS